MKKDRKWNIQENVSLFKWNSKRCVPQRLYTLWLWLCVYVIYIRASIFWESCFYDTLHDTFWITNFFNLTFDMFFHTFFIRYVYILTYRVCICLYHVMECHRIDQFPRDVSNVSTFEPTICINVLDATKSILFMFPFNSYEQWDAIFICIYVTHAMRRAIKYVDMKCILWYVSKIPDLKFLVSVSNGSKFSFFLKKFFNDSDFPIRWPSKVHKYTSLYMYPTEPFMCVHWSFWSFWYVSREEFFSLNCKSKTSFKHLFFSTFQIFVNINISIYILYDMSMTYSMTLRLYDTCHRVCPSFINVSKWCPSWRWRPFQGKYQPFGHLLQNEKLASMIFDTRPKGPLQCPRWYLQTGHWGTRWTATRTMVQFFCRVRTMKRGNRGQKVSLDWWTSHPPTVPTRWCPGLASLLIQTEVLLILWVLDGKSMIFLIRLILRLIYCLCVLKLSFKHHLMVVGGNHDICWPTI